MTAAALALQILVVRGKTETAVTAVFSTPLLVAVLLVVRLMGALALILIWQEAAEEVDGSEAEAVGFLSDFKDTHLVRLFF